MSRPERWPIRIRITTASAYKRRPTAVDTTQGGAEPAPWNVDGPGGTRGMHGASKQDGRAGTDMSGEGKGGRGEPQNTEDMVLTAMVRVLEEAIQSLDTLNDQIVQFIFTPKSSECDGEGDAMSPKERDTLKASMALMRRLLVDAQAKFRKMVDDNKQLASRIDGSIQSANQEVNALRAELADTNKRLTELSCRTENNHIDNDEWRSWDTKKDDPSEQSLRQKEQEVSNLREAKVRLEEDNRSLLKELEELRSQKTIESQSGPAVSELKVQLTQTEHELARAKEALAAMKADRKRLKAEKVDLLNQMKQLYGTLEDKEDELREFIRNYEMRMRESDESIKQLILEKEGSEKEKWEILKKARDSAERSVFLRQQLDQKEGLIKKLETELSQTRLQLEQNQQHQRLSIAESSPRPETLGEASPLPAEDNHISDDLQLSLHVGDSLTPSGSMDMQLHASDGDFPTPRGSMELHTPTPAEPTPRGSVEISPQSVDESKTSVEFYTPEVSLSDSVQDVTQSPIQQHSTPISESAPSSCNLQETPVSEEGLSSNPPSVASTSRYSPVHIPDDSKSDGYNSSRDSGLGGAKKKKSTKKFGSLSKVFGRNKHRKSLDPSLLEEVETQSGSYTLPTRGTLHHSLHQEEAADRLQVLQETRRLPMTQWKADHVLAWLEYTMCMPMYSKHCTENIKSGKVLLGLSDHELESGLGITNNLHRRKLRLAIEEHRTPEASKYSKASQMDHRWVSRTWLTDLGLPQYRPAFESLLVDGRVLATLTRKDLEKYLSISRKFHQVSLLHGIDFLRRVKFDKEALHERRLQCEDIDCDPLVWTNQRLIKWAQNIDLKEYSNNLAESGVHGALLVLEPSFNADAMATALGIPPTKTIIRRHLTTELNSLVMPARATLTVMAGSQAHSRTTWRQRWRTKAKRESREVDGRVTISSSLQSIWAALAAASGGGDSSTRPKSASVLSSRPSSAGSVGRSGFGRSNHQAASDEEKKGSFRRSFRGSLGRAFGKKYREHQARSAVIERTPERQEEEPPPAATPKRSRSQELETTTV
ncbi:PREDICTED: kazrin-like isoform X2 [Branchiostoma belcheri]|uniref:Kazrin-like isoform X2 n=1 Tax=Branchiostoma belcheri TaxID=7741 RepID=A0A6P4Z8E7_BRABE|nr:PREDICTED: kazrin-like isoform X2 [Branchiostoma belcheri]